MNSNGQWYGVEERAVLPMEALWDRVRAWAKANGKVYDPSYGVVDVAAC